MRYPTLDSYTLAVAEYITSEFTDWSAWFAREDELVREVLSQRATFIAACYRDRLLPSVPGECLVTGASVAREISTYSGSPRFEEV